ncbi:MAG: HD-GYP domain-containing protein [Caldilineaceae bacterium]|nr:HD-GYP domain-containing protein [Caldilineaceae bacterium]
MTALTFLTETLASSSWWLFVGAVSITTLLRLYRVKTPSHQAYEGSTIGFVAAVILLPLWQFILLVLITHLVEWAVALLDRKSDHLRAWYIQPFNIAKTILSALPAYWLLTTYTIPIPSALGIADLFVLLFVTVSYVGSSQLMLGLALLLARGISFYQAGIVRDGLTTEMPLALMGTMAAFSYICNPLLVTLVFAPIVLIYQSFLLPKLQQEAIQSLEQFNAELTTANQAIKQVNDELFLTLAKIFDARDPYVGGHAAQVAAYAVAIGKELGLSSERLEVLRQGGYLHDIGKIAIPEAILHKPGKLTDEEFDLLKEHTNIGADFIATSQGLRHLAPFIRHHHERWDGRGYPAGLTAAEIPLEARILNVCDSVEAMASDRPYHRALSAEQIIAEVQRCSGTQFDPVVAQAFIIVAERETNQFIVNSARKVTRQTGEHVQFMPALSLKRLAEIYGMTPAGVA